MDSHSHRSATTLTKNACVTSRLSVSKITGQIPGTLSSNCAPELRWRTVATQSISGSPDNESAQAKTGRMVGSVRRAPARPMLTAGSSVRVRLGEVGGSDRAAI